MRVFGKTAGVEGSAGAAAPDADASGDGRPDRNETPAERLDRNWVSLLQELRVTQTGVQFLTGFLLILPFQGRFEDLDDFEMAVYLATVLCAVMATVMLVAPVGMHRILFRQHRIGTLVQTAHHCAIAGLVLLGLALSGVVTLTFGLVVDEEVGVFAGVACAALFVGVWLLWPWVLRHR
jgi:hypothetical protein